MKPQKTPAPIHWTEEEEHQLRELEAEHPWSSPPRQFLAKVKAEYGRPPVDLLGIGLDERLDPSTLESLCRSQQVPPEDFGLNPEEPDGEYFGLEN
jgi:hypothetical protein